jgi:hypothetical protein
LLLGPWGALAGTVVAGILSVFTNLLLTGAERRELMAVARRYGLTLSRRRVQPARAAAPVD